MTTPTRPIVTPARRRADSLSSSNADTTTTVNNGVVAFRIDASPLPTKVCPVTIRENGSTLLKSASATNGFQPAKLRGILMR